MDETGATKETSAASLAAEQQPLMVAEERKKLKVLVPIDESEGSFYALRWALDYLLSENLVSVGLETQEQDQNTITLLHVVPVFQPFIYPAGPVVYSTSAMVESVKKAQEQSATAILSRALQMCKEKKIKAETIILEGDAKDKICQTADKLYVDLIVVGSRGLGAVKRVLLGSVSNYCAHHAPCPVLIVKPPTKQAHD